MGDTIADHASVQQWAAGLREQWGEDPDMSERHTVLQRFADFTEKDPDAMIADCTREVESGKRIKIKARRRYSDAIAEFQTTIEGTPREQSKAANLIRSFFIHNGIFMQAGLGD